MPAYNEEVVIVGCVSSALKSDYPDFEVIVVSDGSKDRTVELVVKEFDMEITTADPGKSPIATKQVRAVYRCRRDPRLTVIDKAPSGAKADAVNCGINHSSKDWVVIMDADEILPHDTLTKCMTEIVHTPGNVVAAGATLLPTNGGDIQDYQMVEARVSRNKWVGPQIVEYLAAFLASRPGMAAFDALSIVSGGFGLYRRDILNAVGGLAQGSLGEDLDLVMRIHTHMIDRNEPYRLIQVPEAIVWTEFPSTKAVLKRQRVRWHRGLREVMHDYRYALLRPKYGRFGSMALAQMFFFEWVAPMIEGTGYALMLVLLLTRRVTIGVAVSTWVAAEAFGVLVAMISVVIATMHINIYRRFSDKVLLMFWACYMQFGFRQITLIWRLGALRKAKTHVWGEMTRAGFGPTAAKKA
jgi:cellulose synthase/poly-beta-1,6-N-acetylglucosamine synthase-like glycosyltransferase